MWACRSALRSGSTVKGTFAQTSFTREQPLQDYLTSATNSVLPQPTVIVSTVTYLEISPVANGSAQPPPVQASSVRKNDGDRMDIKAIVGITVGSMCGAATLLIVPVFAVWWYRRNNDISLNPFRKRRKAPLDDLHPSQAKEKRSSSSTDESSQDMSQLRSPRREGLSGDRLTTILELYELEGDCAAELPNRSSVAELNKSKKSRLGTIRESVRE